MKKLVLKTLAALTLMYPTLFISCSGKKSVSESFKPRLSKNTACQIHIAGNYKNFEALEAEFDRFNEFYPEVEFTFSYLDNYKSTIKTAMAGQGAPDIYMTFPWMLGRPDYKTVLDSAENMADEKTLGFNLSTIRKELIPNTEDGSVPMVPVLSGSYGMLVNEDLFKKEGLPLPRTYTELLECCRKLKASGYKSPILSYPDNFISIPIIYTHFFRTIEKNQTAIELLNKLDPAAGKYLEPSLEWVDAFMKEGFIDLESCLSIKDKYNAVIMRFFEGDVPLMLCDTDTVSGTLKRESQSDSFINKPFRYSFRTFPSSNEKNDFLNSTAVCFSVNKESANLAVANEFMRFLVRTEELNNLAKIKRLITTSTDYSFDEIYASLSECTPLYSSALGLTDNANKQLRTAFQKVILGSLTPEEAAASYGNF